jgi:uncharacterized damage-inducible protein DinB
MQTIHDLLKARFLVTKRYLDRVLNRLTDQDLSWTPGEGMRSVAGQLLEISNKEKECLGWLQENVYDDSLDVFDPESTTLVEINTLRKSLRADTFLYIDSLSEAELSEPMIPPESWWEALDLEQCPKSEVLRNISAHEWYHTGQLVIYLWLRGEDLEKW